MYTPQKLKELISSTIDKFNSENHHRFCINSYVDGATYYDFYSDFDSASTAIHRYRFLSHHDFKLSDLILDVELITVKNKDLKYHVSDSFIKENYK